MNAADEPSVYDQLQLANGEPVWLQVGRAFDGESVVQNAHLVYDRQRIHWLGAASPPPRCVRAGQQIPDIVLPAHTLLPGLVEAHAHLFLAGGEEAPEARALYLKKEDSELLEAADLRLYRLLRLGVVGVRDAGDRRAVGLALAARCRRRDDLRMPWVESPGAALHHQGRYGSFMGEPVEAYPSMADAVAARVQAQSDHIKLLATGIINFEQGTVTSRPQMTVDEMKQATEVAHRLGRQVMVHCSGHEGVARCVEARVDTVEHGYFISDDQLAQMRDRDIAWVPTLAPVHYQWEQARRLGWSDTVRTHLRRILDEHAARLRRAVDLGVRIVAGSDAGSQGVPHGHGLLRELELMQAAGLAPLAVLRAATGAAARLHLREPVGRLEIGSVPRFLLTEAPVLNDVTQLRRPPIVVVGAAVLRGGDNAGLPGM